MPAVTLYLNDEDYELYKKLQKRRASFLFSQAVREDSGAIENLDRLNKKIELTREEIDNLQQGLSFLEANKARLEKKEIEIRQMKEEIEAKQTQSDLYLIKMWGSEFKEATGKDMTLSDVQAYRSQLTDPKGANNIIKWIDLLKLQHKEALPPQ